ncbi:hypothetical protein [Sulfuracidifex metallicus]|uniref:Uncharacterized protein n=2 Tax=Sulfuracidifex metallicus TaxID=47303 RepID=A0A6A9QVA6_SULME|nr:hypothetical protein [Sulfuracidifex metallicus]MUN29002.1 hypothetical protein [Sulfuracidifex metallicus DSM 6482 = JCM 9184]WOE50488.1 hypothetical protein RQ359_002020 [Sulfuracidifex metallicus DSM 6482 = JCM 9184]
MSGFNGIEGDVNAPGEIPIWMAVLYFIVVGGVYVAALATKKMKFSTLDLVYIGIGGALSVVLEFYVGPIFSRAIPKIPGLDISFGLRLFMVSIFAAIIRKPGAAAAMLALFDILGDIFHYGFGGEPIYLIYEAFTYGFFIDLVTFLSGNHLFGIGMKKMSASKTLLAGFFPAAARFSTVTISEEEEQKDLSWVPLVIVQAIVIGILVSTADPIFYDGFFNPFLYGGVVTWSALIFKFVSYIPWNVITVFLAGIVARRVAKVLG